MIDSFLYPAVEQNIILFLQQYLMFSAPFFKLAGILISRNIFFVIILILYLIYDKKLAKIMAVSISLSSAITMTLKSAVGRDRPFKINSSIKAIQSPGEHLNLFHQSSTHHMSHGGDSFPSGHASSGAAFYGSIAYYIRNKYVTIVCALLITIIGFSRIFLGVHFPSDVIVGTIIGLICVFFVSYLFEKFDSYKPYLIVFVILLVILLVFNGHRSLFTLTTFLGYCLAFLFEEKFVDFKITRNTVPAVSRIVCGIIIYAVLQYVGTMEIFNSMLLKGVLEFLICFILFGVYPLLFNKISIFSDE